MAILVAIGVNSEGFGEILGVAEGAKEDEESWTASLRHLKKRGLKDVVGEGTALHLGQVIRGRGLAEEP